MRGAAGSCALLHSVRLTSERSSCTRTQRPIRVAIEQWLTVGVKKTLRRDVSVRTGRSPAAGALYSAAFVVHVHVVLGHDVKLGEVDMSWRARSVTHFPASPTRLLQRVRVLRVRDVPQVTEHLGRVDGLAPGVSLSVRWRGQHPRRGTPLVHHRRGVDQTGSAAVHQRRPLANEKVAAATAGSDVGFVSRRLQRTPQNGGTR